MLKCLTDSAGVCGYYVCMLYYSCELSNARAELWLSVTVHGTVEEVLLSQNLVLNEVHSPNKLNTREVMNTSAHKLHHVCGDELQLDIN